MHIFLDDRLIRTSYEVRHEVLNAAMRCRGKVPFGKLNYKIAKSEAISMLHGHGNGGKVHRGCNVLFGH